MKASFPKIIWNAGTFSLVAANVVPLVGALFFSWSLASVIFLYWTENVVVGIFNIARMKRARGSLGVGSRQFKVNGKPYTPDMKGSLIFFFIIHYGLFTFVHGVFVLVLFGQPVGLGAVQFLLALASLFISHGISYETNFIGKHEYERMSPPELFFHPYKRVLILHLTVLLGGTLSQLIGFPVVAAVFLILLKMVMDLIIHTWEHRKFSSSSDSLAV